jgi:hypothetical protein
MHSSRQLRGRNPRVEENGQYYYQARNQAPVSRVFPRLMCRPSSRSPIAVLILAAAVAVSARAADLALDRRALEEALALGSSRIEAPRVRFHAPYRIAVGAAPVDYLEVITPFRLVVLEAESAGRSGRLSFGLREAQQAADAAAGDVTLEVELTFHPLNTLVGVPDYAVTMTTAGRTVQARLIDRIPRFGPRVEGAPRATTRTPGGVLAGVGQPLTGGTLVARFAAADLDPRGAYEVTVSEGGRGVARARLDFARLR